MGYGGILAATRPKNLNRESPYTVVNAEATALIARFTAAPSEARKSAIDTLIGALKAAGTWAKMDCLYVEAAHDAQAAQRNWKADTFNLSPQNSPTFTPDRGYTGNGTSSYLDSTFNPSTAGGAFTQNSAHIAVWTGTEADNIAQTDIGQNNARLVARAGLLARTSINASANNDVDLGLTSSVGWTCIARANSANFDAVRNNGTPVNTSRASTTLENLPFYLCARATSGPAATTFSTRRNQAAHWGSALDDTERDATYAALLAYMQVVGAA